MIGVKDVILRPKLIAARKEIERLDYLSYKTRYQMFLSEAGRIHNSFRVYAELVSAKDCLNETPCYFEQDLLKRIHQLLENLFEYVADQSRAFAPLESELLFLRSLWEDDYPSPGSPLFVKSLTDDPEAQAKIDRDMCRIFALNAAGTMTQWVKKIWLDFPELLERDDGSFDPESAEAMDWYLAFHTGLFSLEKTPGNRKFWLSYIDKIIPEAARLEEELGKAAFYHDLESIEKGLEALSTRPVIHVPPPYRLIDPDE